MATTTNSAGTAGQRSRKVSRVLLILIAGLIVIGVLIARWFFPSLYNNAMAQMYSWLARAAALVGSSNIAYKAANQAVAFAPQNAEYLNKRCWYGSLAGDVETVIDDCHRVVEMRPNDAWAHDTLGVALVFMRDFPGAMVEFQSVVDHGGQPNPAIPFLQERIGWIEKLKNGENPFDDRTIKRLLLQ